MRLTGAARPPGRRRGCVAPGASGSTGVSRMPNHVAPSHFRCRASVRIGSLPVRRSSRSIVVMTQRSHTIVVRNGTSPMRTDDQASSAKGSPPATTTLGRNRRCAKGSRGSSPRSSGRLEHPVVEARQRRLRRDVDRRGVGRASCGPPGRRPGLAGSGGASRRPATRAAADAPPVRSATGRRRDRRVERCPDLRSPPARARRRGAASRRAGPRPAASSRTPPPSSGSARSPRRACSSRAVTLVPAGSTTAHRRSPRSPRASTTAASTLTPPSDLTG